MRTTKVVQINSACGRGSTGKIAVSISKQLSEKNVENYVFYSGNHKSDYPLGIMIAGKLSIRIHQLISRFLGDQGFHSSISTWFLIKKIQKIQPDAILLHNLHGYYLNVEMLFRFLKRYGKPVYWTLHDCWAFTGHCTHFSLQGCEKWKTGCFACEQKHKYPYSWFADRSKRLYQKKKNIFNSLDDLTIITPSSWMARLVEKSFLGAYPIKVIQNGIDLKIFKPTESEFRNKYGLENKKIILGVASVWSYYKGLDVFIELFKRIDNSRYQIVLVGTNDKVDQQLPAGIISIHQTQDQVELAGIYTAADVFINPTREENYPTVNMEAIACGTPVVTFDTGGCAEIVCAACGKVVCSNTVDELEETIMQIFRDDSMEKSCLEYAKKFDDQKCFKKYASEICGKE